MGNTLFSRGLDQQQRAAVHGRHSCGDNGRGGCRGGARAPASDGGEQRRRTRGRRTRTLTPHGGERGRRERTAHGGQCQSGGQSGSQCQCHRSVDAATCPCCQRVREPEQPRAASQLPLRTRWLGSDDTTTTAKPRAAAVARRSAGQGRIGLSDGRRHKQVSRWRAASGGRRS